LLHHPTFTVRVFSIILNVLFFLCFNLLLVFCYSIRVFSNNHFLEVSLKLIISGLGAKICHFYYFNLLLRTWLFSHLLSLLHLSFHFVYIYETRCQLLFIFFQ
jgi:hypothetical protein